MKTVLEELKENIDYLFLNTKSDTDFQKGFISCLEHVQSFIETKKLLEAEKQHIEQAYITGRDECHLDYYPKKHATEYYNEKFSK